MRAPSHPHHRILIGLGLLGLGASGCAGQAAGMRADDKPRAGAGVKELRATTETQASRIAELETRIALLEAEWRDSRELARLKPQQTVVIGSGRQAAAKALDPEGDEPVVQRPEPLPTLILDERRDEQPRPVVHASAAAPAASPVQSVPQTTGLPGLGVVPMPATRAQAAARPASPDPREEYRAALRLVRSRQFDAALVALASFLGRHPRHALADHALYWRGEVEYAQRDYARALATFDELGQRFPSSEKRAHALLKAGWCHRRLGDESAAKKHFHRVRKEFPDSEAARVAPGEGAS